MTEAGTTEILTPEPECGQLNVRFRPEAHKRITDYLNSFTSFDPVLALLYGDALPDQPGSWSLMAINESMAADLAHMYAGFGAVVYFDLNGIRAVVPQLAHIEKLEQGLLQFRDDRLVATGGHGSTDDN